ncbi:MAG: response regulator [Anaerolineae bacterium]|nr:response regulator [Anaerolineae bacterium]
MHEKSIDILLVEDNPGDVFLTQEALLDSKIANKLYDVKDGVEASDFLYKRAPYQNVPTPDLILLDLNMPRKDGRQLLAEIKQDVQLRLIPVIVFTTSAADEDILQSYGLHANAYITKPIDFHQFIQVIRAIDNFWFAVVKLPPLKRR